MRPDLALLCAFALLGGSAAAVCPVPATAAGLACLLVLGRRVPFAALAVLVVIFGLSAQRARGCVADFVARSTSARAALGEPRRCTGVVRVTGSPARALDRTSYDATVERADCESRPLAHATALRLHGGPPDLGRGDRLEVVADLAAVPVHDNPELGDAMAAAARRGAVLSGGVLASSVVERGHGLGRRIDGLRNHARERIDATFTPVAAPLARALVLGEGGLAPEENEAFRLSGLTHILAVSGTHLVLAVGTVVAALRALLARVERLAVPLDVARVSATVGIALALLYADFAGGSGSAWRAAWMLTAGYAARALGRHPRPVRTLALSLIAGGLADPLLAFDVSFLLSAAATAGLIVLGQPLSRSVARLGNRAVRLLAGAVSTTLSATVACAPLIALLSPSITLVGVVANVVAAPIGELVALPLCLAHPLLGFSPTLERGTALVASGALGWVSLVAHAGAAVGWLALPVPPPSAWHVALLAVAGLGVALGGRGRRVPWLAAGGLALLVTEAACRAEAKPRGVLRVAALDVGQGDALLVDLPDRRAMLIDAGGSVGSADPGRRIVAPVLRARRRHRVDVVVISHPHPDHFGGLAAALRDVDVGELWDTGQGEVEGAGPEYRALLADLRARGVPVRRPAELCASEQRFGAAVVRVLDPCPGFRPGESANDNSFVLRVTLGERSALLVGDAEQQQEARLVERGAELSADLLKVGHHGSRTSSSTSWLGAVRPGLAFVSSGVRNRFGHPHPEALGRLEQRAVHILRTDRSGQLVWSTDGVQVRLRTARSTPRAGD